MKGLKLLQKVAALNPAFGTKEAINNNGERFHSLSPSQSPNDNVILMKPDKPTYPYKPARYVATKSKSYIEFYLYNQVTEKLERIRNYEIDKYVNTSSFREMKSKFIKEINEMLASGAYKGLAPAPMEKPISIRDAFDFVIKLKKVRTRERTPKDYQYCINLFTEFSEKKEPTLLDRLITDLTDKKLVEFIEWLELEKKLAPYTVNNQKTYLNTILNDLVGSHKLANNPFKTKKLVPVSEKKNVAFDKQQLSAIQKALNGKDQLRLFFHFMFYTFARRNETRLFKLKYLRWETLSGEIPGNISKTGRGRTFEITDPLLKELKKLNLEQYDPDFYLFGRGGLPGLEPKGRNHFSNEFRKVLDSLGLPIEYTLYSTKHTGVTMHFLAGYDLRWLQDQAGFKSLETLQKYLRSLGLRQNRSKDIQPPKIS